MSIISQGNKIGCAVYDPHTCKVYLLEDLKIDKGDNIAARIVPVVGERDQSFKRSTSQMFTADLDKSGNDIIVTCTSKKSVIWTALLNLSNCSASSLPALLLAHEQSL